MRFEEYLHLTCSFDAGFNTNDIQDARSFFVSGSIVLKCDKCGKVSKSENYPLVTIEGGRLSDFDGDHTTSIDSYCDVCDKEFHVTSTFVSITREEIGSETIFHLTAEAPASFRPTEVLIVDSDDNELIGEISE